MKSEKKCVLIYSIVLYHLKFKVKSNLDTYSFFNYKIYFRDNNMTKLWASKQYLVTQACLTIMQSMCMQISNMLACLIRNNINVSRFFFFFSLWKIN